MKRKAIATIAAIATMTSMLGMTAFATETTEPEWNVNGGKATVEGEATVYQPTIEVVLPGDLAFGINPLKLTVETNEDGTGGTDAQIISGEFFVENHSDIPVAVTVTTFVSKAGDKIALLEDASWNTTTSELNPTAGKSAIWLVQLYAETITTEAEKDPVATFAGIIAGTTTKDDVKGDTLVKVASEANPTEVSKKPIFVLNAWTETVANQKDCMAAFKFGGAVDPNATFADGDITVKAIFELETLTATQVEKNYDEYETVGGTALPNTNTIKKVKSTPAAGG